MSHPVLLIDGVKRPDALKWLYATDASREIVPLYAGTRWRQLMEHGPILALLNVGSPLLHAWNNHDRTLQGQASLLYSRASVADIARHLRQFIQMRDVHGSYSLVRFADPLVTRYWLSGYSDVAMEHVLGPINEWHVATLPPAWDPARPVIRKVFRHHPSNGGYDQPLDLLGTGQLEALQQACRHLFHERLYRHLQSLSPTTLEPLAPDQRERWLDRSLDDALAWGANSERGAALWALCRARLGEGFADCADGPFQRCLARLPEVRTLAHDARLQAVADMLFV